MKKIVLLMLFALPLSLMAQEKLAHVNVQEIFQVMPDLSNIEKTVADMNEQYKKELDVMYQEYSAKAKEYQDNLATMAETIKTKRQSEILDLEKRIGTFQQQANEDLQKKQLEMVNALRDKILKATAEVAAESKYAYVFDVSAQSVAYYSPNATDITPLVKKKLGIK
jgi:outer membrane protein